ncbi:helix-turn-helix domain-containing protein [Gemmatimonadota bacterium]
MNTSIAFQTDTEIMERIGGRLRRLRRAQEWTVAAVAERTELNPSTIARAESGQNPTLLTLTRLLRCYGALGSLEEFIPEPAVSPIRAAEARRKEARG